MLRKYSGYVRAKQFNRAESAVRTLRQYLKNVVDFAESQPIVPRNMRELRLIAMLQEYVARSRRPLAQDKSTPGRDKIHSFHEPQVECIAKGKVHKRYEFGVKAGFVTAYCDLGYRGHDYKGDIQVVNRFRKRKPRALLRWWKRRSAFEPVIGHVKSDHGIDRNMLAGSKGDKVNAMLAGVGFNLLKLMKGLRRLFLYLRTEANGFADFLSVTIRVWLCNATRIRMPLRSCCC